MDAPTKPTALALDVGGTWVKSAPVTSDGELLEEPRVAPIDSHADAQTIFGTLATVINHYLAGKQALQLRGIALGFPGPFDYAAGISYIQGVSKYEAIYGLDVGAALRSRVLTPHLPIVFRNDAEAAVIGEAQYGAGRGYSRAIGVTLGTGMGSAFVVDGAPVTTGPGVPPNGWLYSFPAGDAQADDVFSIRGLLARLQAVDAQISDIRNAAALAHAGNASFQEVFAQWGSDLGAFLRPFALAFQAQVILALGGIANAFDCFGPALTSALPIPAVPGELGTNAALVGAAELIFRS